MKSNNSPSSKTFRHFFFLFSATTRQGLGQLTPVGMQMHYNIGQYFRQRYMVNSQFVPQDYNVAWVSAAAPAEFCAPGRSQLNLSPRLLTLSLFQMSVRSTDYDRTLMSAESQLAGWFRPDSSYFNNSQLLWQPVPVHTVPCAEDSLLLAAEPKRKIFIATFVHSDQLSQSSNTNFFFSSFFSILPSGQLPSLSRIDQSASISARLESQGE